MKKNGLILFGFILIFTLGFILGRKTIKVFVEDEQVYNNGDYIIISNKIYVSEDALRRDFGFSIFFNKKENRLRLYNLEKMAYESRCSLYEKFLEKYDPQNPDNVVKLWAQGVKERNGVYQFAVLNKDLKNEFKQLAEKKNRLAWVTGFSSPWVTDYEISKEQIDEDSWLYTVNFKATAVSQIYNWNATIIVNKENGKWRITEIIKDFDIM